MSSTASLKGMPHRGHPGCKCTQLGTQYTIIQRTIPAGSFEKGKKKNMTKLASSKTVSNLREEIALAEIAYANYEQTGDIAGMSPHEMRDYIEVRENEIRSRITNS